MCVCIYVYIHIHYIFDGKCGLRWRFEFGPTVRETLLYHLLY